MFVLGRFIFEKKEENWQKERERERGRGNGRENIGQLTTALVIYYSLIVIISKCNKKTWPNTRQDWLGNILLTRKPLVQNV